ncbi:hypothetical protein GCM10022258_17680 [Aquimarina gracilis]
MVPWVETLLENLPKVCFTPASPGLMTAQFVNNNRVPISKKIFVFIHMLFKLNKMNFHKVIKQYSYIFIYIYYDLY